MVFGKGKQAKNPPADPATKPTSDLMTAGQPNPGAGPVPDMSKPMKKVFTNDDGGTDGVLFWLRSRLDGPNMTPQFFDDPAKAPPGSVAGEAHYARVEYPPGSGLMLSIIGARRICDRETIIHLISSAKAQGFGSKAGALLFNPAEVIAQGWLTEEELAEAGMGRHPDGDEAGAPNAPMPDFGLMYPDQLETWLVKNHVKFDQMWMKGRKEKAAAKWWKERAQSKIKQQNKDREKRKANLAAKDEDAGSE